MEKKRLILFFHGSGQNTERLYFDPLDLYYSSTRYHPQHTKSDKIWKLRQSYNLYIYSGFGYKNVGDLNSFSYRKYAIPDMNNLLRQATGCFGKHNSGGFTYKPLDNQWKDYNVVNTNSYKPDKQYENECPRFDIHGIYNRHNRTAVYDELLICGHSRGAVTAILLAIKLCKDKLVDPYRISLVCNEPVPGNISRSARLLLLDPTVAIPAQFIHDNFRTLQSRMDDLKKIPIKHCAFIIGGYFSKCPFMSRYLPKINEVTICDINVIKALDHEYIGEHFAAYTTLFLKGTRIKPTERYTDLRTYDDFFHMHIDNSSYISPNYFHNIKSSFLPDKLKNKIPMTIPYFKEIWYFGRTEDEISEYEVIDLIDIIDIASFVYKLYIRSKSKLYNDKKEKMLKATFIRLISLDFIAFKRGPNRGLMFKDHEIHLGSLVYDAFKAADLIRGFTRKRPNTMNFAVRLMNHPNYFKVKYYLQLYIQDWERAHNKIYLPTNSKQYNCTYCHHMLDRSLFCINEKCISTKFTNEKFRPLKKFDPRIYKEDRHRDDSLWITQPPVHLSDEKKGPLCASLLNIEEFKNSELLESKSRSTQSFHELGNYEAAIEDIFNYVKKQDD